MLIKSKSLKEYKLYSLDGEIGTVKKFYFDDHHWTIRYLIAETGDWLIGRQVLISPHAMTDVNKERQYISINLTKKQIEDSPTLDNDKPISRQFEESYFGHYGYPMYWGGPYMWGSHSYIACDPHKRIEPAQGEKTWDYRLHSTYDLSGYAIQTTDGEIGHIDDFILDDVLWAIRYLIIDTRNWWPGKTVIISPQWIKRISWRKKEVFINLLCEAIKLSPEYTDEALMTRDYENGLHVHYNRQRYWVNEQPGKVN